MMEIYFHITFTMFFIIIAGALQLCLALRAWDALNDKRQFTEFLCFHIRGVFIHQTNHVLRYRSVLHILARDNLLDQLRHEFLTTQLFIDSGTNAKHLFNHSGSFFFFLFYFAWCSRANTIFAYTQ